VLWLQAFLLSQAESWRAFACLETGEFVPKILARLWKSPGQCWTGVRRVMRHWGSGRFWLRGDLRCSLVVSFGLWLHCGWRFAVPWAFSLSLSRKNCFDIMFLSRKAGSFSTVPDNPGSGLISQNTGPNSIWKYHIRWKMNLRYIFVNLTQIVQLGSELQCRKLRKVLSLYRYRRRDWCVDYA
jgi:hypothetical protein